jgi:transposase InsO family protein
VWAVDFNFTGPRPAIAGRYRYLLAVRDLASGRQLMWRPVEAATGEVARDALAALFAEHGAPVVLKCDNGSAFTSAVVEEMLAEHEVAGLFTPPHWPRYNGSVEAGIGSLKERTDACRRGVDTRDSGVGKTWPVRARRRTRCRVRGVLHVRARASCGRPGSRSRPRTERRSGLLWKWLGRRCGRRQSLVRARRRW